MNGQRSNVRQPAGSSPNSRHSSMVHMPPIAEDEQPARSAAPSRTSSKAPLRVPQKSSRRALYANFRMNGTGHEPPPYGSSPFGDDDGESVPDSLTPNHSPPRYHNKTFTSSFSDTTAGSTRGSVLMQTPVIGEKESSDVKGWKTKQWFGRRRTRWAAFIALGVILIALVIGLSVGLAVGLNKDKNDKAKEEANMEASTKLLTTFPAGSFSLETTLLNVSTACSSNPSTWRCYPYAVSSNATYYWSILPSSSSDTSFARNNGEYTISSSDNPFAPSFTNLTMTLHEQGTPDEHFTFQFDMNKTVIPDGPLGDDTRSARCSFGGTQFQGTLWTRRRGEEKITPPESTAGIKFGAWPGDVEVRQVKGAEKGQPECKDVDENVIAVAEGDGECTCDYANFQP